MSALFPVYMARMAQEERTLLQVRRPRVHTLLTTTSEAYDFWLKLRKPPTVEGYQEAIAATMRSLRLRQSADSLDILYNRMLLLEQWSPPETTKSRKPRYFRSLDDWRAVMVPLIQANDSPGDPVTQERVAPYLQEHLPKRSAKQAMRKDESVKKLIYRTGLKFGYTWDDLVREARSQLLPE